MSGRLPVTERTFSEADVAAVTAALESGWLTMGPRIKALEERLAAWADAPHAMVVSSGTAGLTLALRALGVTPGDEVGVAAFGSLGPRAAVRLAGARAVTEAGPRVTIATHLLGWVEPGAARASVEDATQAVGADLGPAGPAAIRVFSLSSASQLPVGEGGIVACWDDDAATTIRSLRSHAMTSGTWDRHRGHQDSYDVVDLGYNFRLDEPRAALAGSLLDRLPAAVAARRAAVTAARAALAGTAWSVPFAPERDATASPAALPLLAPDQAERDAALARLEAAGLPAVAWDGADRLVIAALPDRLAPSRATEIADTAAGPRR